MTRPDRQLVFGLASEELTRRGVSAFPHGGSDREWRFELNEEAWGLCAAHFEEISGQVLDRDWDTRLYGYPAVKVPNHELVRLVEVGVRQ